MNGETLRVRIMTTQLLGPALKSQLVEQLPYLDDERAYWLATLLERAESSFQVFGEKAKQYKATLDEIEDFAMAAAGNEAEKILREFYRELHGIKS